MKKHLPGWAVLLIITLAAGLALGGTYALTKDPIDQQALISAENARKAALPDAESFEELTLAEGASVDWAYAGLKEGNTVGYVAQKTVNGFGGKVEVIAGVDTSNAPDTFAIGGISVGGSSFSETAGLGARSKEPAFTDQFTGKIYPVSFIKAGGTPTDSTVDALTSATITTTALVNGVNDIVKYIKADVMGIAGVEMPAKPGSGVYSSSEKGFRGQVYVEAAFDAAGKVTYISVGDENFAEDIGAGVVEPDFMYQFIGKQMPLEVSDIDVISGATISSTAVVKALNNAYAIAGGAEIVVPETPTMPEKPAEGVYNATAQGFRGPVYVEAAFDAGSKITYLSVGDDEFAEDIGAGVKEPDFMYQFIGKTAPVELSDIDVIAGATISSTAVVNALKTAYNASQGIVEEVKEVTLPEAPAEGVYSASKQGFGGPVAVSAAFDADGKITYISIGDDAFAETAGLGATALEAEFQAQFIGKQMPLTLSDIDAIAGATVTSTAVVDALNEAYDLSQGKVAETTETETVEAEKPAVTYGADAFGFESDVYVEAAFEDGKITWISIGDKRFAETAGLGAKALEPEFAAQFIGKAMPIALSDIDAISGATFTSQAVVDALNKAYAKYEAAASAPTYKADAYGFESDVAVEVGFDGNTITSLTIGDKRFAETAGLGAKALEPDFAAQFIGKTAPLALADIDAISGATFTSQAVVDAINKAYDKYLADAGTSETAEPAAQSGTTYTASAQGFGGPVAVEAAFDADGRITAISIGDDQFAETTGLGAKALEDSFQQQFIGKQMPLALSDIDAIAGATVTSTAVVNALNAAYEQSLSGGEAEITEEPAEEASAAPAFKDVRHSVGISSQTSDMQVKVSFVQNTVAGLVVMERPVGSDKAYAVSELDTEMKDRFLAATLPIAVESLETPEAALVANAINAAYYAQGGAMKAKPAVETEAAVTEEPATEEPAAEVPVVEIIGGADEPTAIILTQPADEDGWYTSEVICFFTAVKVEAQFADGKVAALNVSDKQIGSEADFAPSSQQAAMEALFVGASLPINNNQMTPYASAVAIVLNQAFGQTGQTVAAEPSVSGGAQVGSSIMFFSEYVALASFDGNELANYEIYIVPVSAEKPEDILIVDDPALADALIGREMPLNPADYLGSIGDVPAYAVNAIVIALNDAYNQSSAGQQ